MRIYRLISSPEMHEKKLAMTLKIVREISIIVRIFNNKQNSVLIRMLKRVADGECHF